MTPAATAAVIDARLRALRELVAAGRLDWLSLAIQERAHTGLVLYATWENLTAKERQSMGLMSQTKARKALGLAP